jgi:peptidoglycan/LPS O-acetylase OafA/YrhL
MYGFSGVLLFFSISGFLMASAVERHTIKEFATLRILRIYPTYFVAVTIAIILTPQPVMSLLKTNAASLTLLPLGRVYGPLQIEWTLTYEIFFYILTAVFCLRSLTKYFPAFACVWLIAIWIAMFGFNFYGTTQFPTFLEAPFSAWSLGFVMGVLAYHLHKIRPILVVARYCGPVLILFGMAWLQLGITVSSYTQILITPILMAAIILYLATLKPPAEPNATLVLLGDSTFGLYLIHQTVAGFVITDGPIRLLTDPASIFVLLTVTCLAAGLILGQIDVRLYKLFRSLTVRRSHSVELRHVRPAMPSDIAAVASGSAGGQGSKT